MRKRVGILSLSVVLSVGMLLSGCGSSDKGMYTAATEEAVEYPMMDAQGALYESKSTASFDENALENPDISENNVTDTSRKLITTMNISSETENLDSTMSTVENKVKEFGGYIESSDIYNGSSYSGRTNNRNANLTIRIPASKLEDFISIVEGNTNITSKSRNVEDVTLSYVDTESRKKALQTEEKRLLEILEKAETVEDLITVESRLSEVRYQLESTEAQLRTYDNRVNYSTIYLDIREVSRYTPVQEKGPLSRMAEGFVDSLHAVGDVFAELLVWIVIHIPQILVVAIVIVIIVIVLKKLIRKSSRKAVVNNMAVQQGFNPYENGQPVCSDQSVPNAAEERKDGQ